MASSSSRPPQTKPTRPGAHSRLMLPLLSPSRSASIRHCHRHCCQRVAAPAAAAADGMCACKSPISFAHFLHFKIRSAKEGEREGESEGVSASKMGPRTAFALTACLLAGWLLPMLMPQTHHKQRLKPQIWASWLGGLTHRKRALHCRMSAASGMPNGAFKQRLRPAAHSPAKNAIRPDLAVVSMPSRHRSQGNSSQSDAPQSYKQM